jgi:hypothetical protein
LLVVASLLAGAGAHVARAMLAAKILILDTVLILANISKANECRIGAKFRVRMLLIRL